MDYKLEKFDLVFIVIVGAIFIIAAIFTAATGEPPPNWAL